MGDYGSFFMENIILISILIFTVSYLILNGLTTRGEITRPLIITLIVTLTSYLFCDSDDVSYSYNKYKIIERSESPFYQNEFKPKYNPMNPNKKMLSNNNIFIKQSDLKNNTYRLKY